MSLIAMLTERLNLPIQRGESRVTATLAGEELAVRLNISPLTAMLRLEHVGYGPTGDPIFMDITSSIGERYVMQVAQGFYR